MYSECNYYLDEQFRVFQETIDRKTHGRQSMWYYLTKILKIISKHAYKTYNVNLSIFRYLNIYLLSLSLNEKKQRSRILKKKKKS